MTPGSVPSTERHSAPGSAASEPLSPEDYSEKRARWRYVTERITIQADGCWLWKGSLSSGGYGYAWWKAGYHRAHRFAYEVAVGSIAEGLDLDHLCRNRACVNPAHLEPVTRAENLRRGRNPRREQTHCKNGHPFDAENTVIRSGSASRDCRICMCDRRRKWRERKRAERAA